LFLFGQPHIAGVLLPVASAAKQQHVAEGKVHEVHACKRKQN
jgi:hypothetical protein